MEVRDPWKHRSTGMKCQTCMWFVMKAPTGDEERPESAAFVGKSVGRCRKHAPTLNGYPVVFNLDWCGDHKLNENLDALAPEPE